MELAFAGLHYGTRGIRRGGQVPRGALAPTSDPRPRAKRVLAAMQAKLVNGAPDAAASSA